MAIAMSSHMKLVFFLSCLLIQLVQPLTINQAYSCVGGNSTVDDAYQTSLYGLLLTFSNTLAEDGFYNSTDGEANGIGLCRGDISPSDCRSCITNATVYLLQLCPNYKEAILYHDLCTFRYSNRSIFGTPEYSPASLTRAVANFSDLDLSVEKRDSLLLQLTETAASGGSRKKFATGETAADFYTIYGLVQCTPDLEQQECVDCLADLSGVAADFLRYVRGGRARAPSCVFRYEVYSFYDSEQSPAPRTDGSTAGDGMDPRTDGSTAGDGESNRMRNTVILTVVSSAVLIPCICICVCIYICLRRRKWKHEYEDLSVKLPPAAEEKLVEMESLQFNLGSIRNATDDFSDSNKLGQGGFGPVYKGTLFNGRDIAVKRLSKGSAQGEQEFENEVLLVAKLQHRNLARLLGFCLQGNERLLIYEFVPNGSLDHFLFDPIKRSQLHWETRYKIIAGIARGLLYLHEDSRLRIIHRDLKANNILLDEEMNPKISDFGMAKLFLLNQTRGDTNRIVGTYGYMAPEYAMYGNFSIKSDVYSFGILILEIVMGKKNTSFSSEENMEGMTSFAWRSWREGLGSNLIDPSISSSSRSEIMKCIHIGLLCVQENPADRPTMASIILMLTSDSVALPLPSRPGFFIHGNMNSNPKVTSSSDNASTQMSINNTSITELHPR